MFNKKAISRYFVPLSSEWKNGTYSYNKQHVNIASGIYKQVVDIINSYLNIYDNMLEDNVRKTRSNLIRLNNFKLSMKKVFLSNLEIKQTSDKLTIIMYVNNNYQNKHYIKKINDNSLVNNMSKKLFIEHNYLLNNVNKQMLNANELKIMNVTYGKYFLISNRKIKSIINNHVNIDNDDNTKEYINDYNYSLFVKDKIESIKQILNTFAKTLTNNKYNENKHDVIWNYYINKLLNTYFNKSLLAKISYLYYKQILSFNKQKYDKSYILFLANEIKKIYNKNIDFSIINIKYTHLDVNMLSRLVKNKITYSSHRSRKISSAIRYPSKIFKLPSISRDIIYKENNKKKIIIQSPKFDELLITEPQKYLSKEIVNSIENKSNVFPFKVYLDRLNYIVNDIKYKTIKGVKMEVKGRLSFKSANSMSVYRVATTGTTKNIDSSWKKLSTSNIRGIYSPSNQYAKEISKLRIGAFGIKGWISSM